MGPDNEQKLTSPLFSRFCWACLEVDKQAHHHPRSKRIKHALTLFMLLCLTGRWFDVNELNQMIPYQLFPLLFYILRKVGAYIFLFKNELLLFSPFTHPYFAPTLEYEWDPRFFAPSRIAAIEVLAENVLYGYHSLASLISFISYVWCVVGHTFFSAFFILKYTTLNNDKKVGSARGRFLDANKKVDGVFMRSLIWSNT